MRRITALLLVSTAVLVAVPVVAPGDTAPAKGQSLTVRLTCPRSPAAAVGVPVKAGGRDDATGSHWTETVVTDDAGVARFASVPAGELSLHFQFSHDALWRAAARSVTVRANEAAELAAELEPTYPVTGRVVDADTGEPVAGATVLGATPFGREDRDTGSPTPPTGADGRYTLRALPGGVSVFVMSWPEGYAEAVKSQAYATVELGQQGATAPDIEIHRALMLSGLVVDAQGRPVPGAEVQRSVSGAPAASVTDAQGRFEFALPHGSEPLHLRARAGDRMTLQPVTATPGQAETVRLVLADKAACRIRVRAVDQAGEPVSQAKVVVWATEDGFGEPVVTGATDARGFYTTPGLWPDSAYTLEVTKPGYVRARTEAWPAKPGARHDCGTLTMNHATGAVAGRVVDMEGRPVAGAAVSAGGEGPQAAEVKTDAEGRFSFEGLFPGSVWVAAISPGAVGGARVQTDGEECVITLRPLPHGEKLGPVHAAPEDYEADRRVAKELLEEGARRFAAVPGDMLDRIAAWAMLDPERAYELSAAAGGVLDGRVTQRLAELLPRDDPQEVLARIGEITYLPERVRAYTIAAKRLTMAMGHLPDAEARPLLDLVFTAANRAVVEAGSIPDEAERVKRLARAGEALYDLDPAAAEPVLRRVQQAAAKLGSEGEEARARGCAAQALCRLDLPAALDLIAALGGPRNVKTSVRVVQGSPAWSMSARWQVFGFEGPIAARIAPLAPKQAAELLQDAEGAFLDRDMPQVVYAMAPVDLRRALELARGLETPWDRARSLGYTALAIANDRPDEAAAALEEAVAALVDESGSVRHFSSQGLSSTAAELAAIGRRIGYPQLEPLMWLALAKRQSATASGDYQSAYLHGLALACPETTAEILRDLWTQPATDKPRPFDQKVLREALAAAACGGDLAAEYLRSLADDDEKAADWNSRVWGRTIELLLTDPAERFGLLLSSGESWAAGAPEPY